MNVAFFYVDQGKPWWRDAVANLVETARATQPGCHITHMSDRKNGQFPGTDAALVSEEQIDHAQMMAAKGYMWSVMGQKTEQNLLLTDADVSFRRDMAPLFDGDWDVALLRRHGCGRAPAQPYLAAMALTKPTPGARRFWTEYNAVLCSLPKAWWAWWCDQIAFAALLGANRSHGDFIDCDGYRVRLFDADAIAPQHGDADCYAVHYKGRHEEKNAA